MIMFLNFQINQKYLDTIKVYIKKNEIENGMSAIAFSSKKWLRILSQKNLVNMV